MDSTEETEKRWAVSVVFQTFAYWVEVYCGKISDDGRVENITIVPMKFVSEEKEYKRYTYTAKISLATGGNYGYTFRVMPTNKMLLDSENLDLVKWITK